MKVLFKGGYVANARPDLSGKMDVLIVDDRIAQLAKDINISDCKVINIEGKTLLPGLIDVHCHLRDPGYEYKENIATGTRSAAMGGFTTIACMANTQPVADNRAVIDYIKKKVKAEGVVKVMPIGSITKNLEGKELSLMGEMKEAGIIAVSDDGKTVMDGHLMLKAMEYASNFDLPVICHCEDASIARDGVVNMGYISTITGLRGISRVAEDAIVARDLMLAGETGAHVHIAHVSTAGSVELIKTAKDKGIRVTCETAPHYFSLTEKAVENFDTFAKVNPPLRTEEDVQAIKQALKDGIIDIIATDHAPHHLDEKLVEFDLAAFGISGLETALALGVTELVESGVMDIHGLVDKMSYTPARIFKLPGGIIQEDTPADIVVVDLKKSYEIDADKFVSLGKNTPFNGKKVKGKVEYTMVSGQLVVSRGVLGGNK
ncbi:MAG TPA: dihydroorotase [Clostridiales bacterium]|nr:dihydroorotase [Clostridiales bacterium]